MITLLWKELRENAKWALLAMLVLGAAEIYALYPANMQEETYGSMMSGSTLVRTTFLTVTTFGCAAVGFILGLIQILPEMQRDRWAMLLHRPVTRGVVFRGKALAGLILYLLATVTPFLLAVYLTATPGHFSTPFVPEMVFPGTADICMGAVYYMAALATGLQRSGWWILRAFPLLAAIHASYFVNATAYFYVAVEAAVLMGLALFTSAWGQMLNLDSISRRPWLGRLAFMAVVFYGTCGLGELIFSFTGSLVTQPYGNFQRYELTDDGTPVSLIYGKGGVIVSVLNLDGTPNTNPRYQPSKVRNHLKYLNGFSEYIGDAHDYKPIDYKPTYRECRAYFWGNNPISVPKLEHWYYMVKDRYLIGFYPDKRQAFAILDQDGFKPATATPRSFLPDVKMGYVSQEATSLYGKDSVRFAFFGDQRMMDVPLPAPGPIYGSGNAFTSQGQLSVETVGYALGTGMAIFDTKGDLITFLPYQHDVSQWGKIQLGISGKLDRFFLWYQPSGFIDSKSMWYQEKGSPDDIQLRTMPSYIDEVDAKGNVVHTYTLPAVYVDPKRPRTWVMILKMRMQTPAFFFGDLLYREVGGLLGSDRLRGEVKWVLGSIWNHDDTRGNITWLPPIYFVLGLLALAMARRVYYSWPRAIGWAVFVALFGIPGLVVFRLTSDWPTLVPCPTCSKPRPTKMDLCPVCNAGWPKPPATGVEIIDQSRELTGTVASA